MLGKNPLGSSSPYLVSRRRSAKPAQPLAGGGAFPSGDGASGAGISVLFHSWSEEPCLDVTRVILHYFSSDLGWCYLQLSQYLVCYWIPKDFYGKPRNFSLNILTFGTGSDLSKFISLPPPLALRFLGGFGELKNVKCLIKYLHGVSTQWTLASSPSWSACSQSFLFCLEWQSYDCMSFSVSGSSSEKNTDDMLLYAHYPGFSGDQVR